MHKGRFLLSLVALMGFAVLGAQSALAQEATPTAEQEDIELPGGMMTLELIGAGEATELPTAPADILLFRIGLEPGASFPLHSFDPSVTLVSVEVGSVTVNADTSLTVLTTARDLEALEEETMSAGEEFTLEAGDSVLFPPRVLGEVRNDGTAPASLLVVNVAPGEESELATPVG